MFCLLLFCAPDKFLVKSAGSNLVAGACSNQKVRKLINYFLGFGCCGCCCSGGVTVVLVPVVVVVGGGGGVCGGGGVLRLKNGNMVWLRSLWCVVGFVCCCWDKVFFVLLFA